MIEVTGIYETHLTVASLKVSVPFYRDVVGLELAEVFDDRIAFFWVAGKAGGMLDRWQSGRAPMGMRLHIAFNASLKVWSTRSNSSQGTWRAATVGFSNDPIDEPVVIGWMPALVSQYFVDPDGHSIEYIHILDEAADPAFGVAPYSKWIERPHKLSSGMIAGGLPRTATS